MHAYIHTYIHTDHTHIHIYIYHIYIYIIYIYSDILTSLCPLCQAHHWWCLRCRPMRNVPCAGPQPPLGPCSWLAWQQLGNDETEIVPELFGLPNIGVSHIYIYIYVCNVCNVCNVCMYVISIYIYVCKYLLYIYNIVYIYIYMETYIYIVSITGWWCNNLRLWLIYC